MMQEVPLTGIGLGSFISELPNYRKLTKEEEEQKQLQEQNETIKDIGKTFEKLNLNGKNQDNQSYGKNNPEELFPVNLIQIKYRTVRFYRGCTVNTYPTYKH
jgi:hypothetical protein